MKNKKTILKDGYSVLQNELILDIIDNNKKLTDGEKARLKTIKMTIRNQRRGHAGYRYVLECGPTDCNTIDWNGMTYVERHYITIPKWTIDDPECASGMSRNDYDESLLPRYFEYYVLHELAHVLQKFEDTKDRGHSEIFYKHFTRICPEELQHFELGYKPRNATSAGVAGKRS
jgi:hypothetical protein